MDLERVLRRAHKIRPGGENDFTIRNQQDILSTQQEATQVFTTLLASIAAVSLLVGGIGIMNIMLVSVTERTREIGVRKALGATRRDILVQFVLESATLTSLGGTVGVVVGYGIARVVSHTAGWPTSMTWQSAALGLAVACGAGILFGLWPAYQAAKVNPIEALRAG